MELTAREISRRLSRQSGYPDDNPYPPELLPPTLRHAAVLIPLFEISNSWHTLFIHRADNEQDHHSGQVAFPGGCKQSDDKDLEQTALRETYEEIGLEDKHIKILGRLRDFISYPSYRVTPFVGLISWPCKLQADTREVRHVFTIPMTWLADNSHHEAKMRHLSANHPPVPVTYFREFQGEVLWGASARITLSLMDALTKD